MLKSVPYRLLELKCLARFSDVARLISSALCSIDMFVFQWRFTSVLLRTGFQASYAVRPAYACAFALKKVLISWQFSLFGPVVASGRGRYVVEVAVN